MKEQIQKLCNIANELDKKGHHKLASNLDSVVAMLTKEAFMDENGWLERHASAWEQVDQGLSNYMSCMQLFMRGSKHEPVSAEAMMQANKSMKFARKQFELWQARKSEMADILAKAKQMPADDVELKAPEAAPMAAAPEAPSETLPLSV